MRIVLAGTFEGLGGIQIHLGSLARVLAASGHQLLLLSFGGGGRSGDEGTSLDGMNAPGIKLERVGKGSAMANLSAARRALREFKPEIYLACGTGWNLFAGAILERVPCRIFHEVMSGESSGWRDSRNLVSRCFHRVVAQALPVAKNFARSFGWKEAIEVIPAFSQPLEAVNAARRTVPHGSARAAIFGRLVPHKRVAWLLSQWPRLKQSLRELHIHGTGPEEVFIRDLIAKHAWQDSVFCHGPYPSGQAYADLMAQYDLTLLPTRGAEGAPLVLLESMACGVPFVTTDAGGIRDYDNPDCIISDAHNDDSFLRSVELITTRLSQREIDQPRLQQFYRAHFSHEALARKWIGMFNSVASSVSR